MLGALEVKTMVRVAAEHRAEWKLLHTAVMSCLLAHRNRRTGDCFPRREVIAAFCNVNVRSVDRAIAQLAFWGAIGREQPKAVGSAQFRPAQYTFLFPLPSAEESQNPCDKIGGAVRQNQPSPCDKNRGSRATKTGGAVRQKRDRNKEEARKILSQNLSQRSKAKPESSKGRGEAATQVSLPPPLPPKIGPATPDEDLDQFGRSGMTAAEFRKVARANHWTEEEITAQLDYAAAVEGERSRLVADLPGNWLTAPLAPSAHGYSQADFDERDWRKLQKEIAALEPFGIRSADKTESERLALLRKAVAKAGISMRRANELHERMLA